MPAVSENDESLWMPRAVVASLVALTQGHFDEVLRKSLPPTAIRGEGRKLRFFAPDVVAAWHRQKVSKLQQVAQATDADPLLATGDSPALERYRDEKAKLAKMDREEREKTHVKLTDLEPTILKLFGLLRSANEDVQRQWGNDPAQRINEALDEAEAGLTRLTDDGSGSGDTEGHKGGALATVADDS